jgi:hypothetical protein
MGRDGKRPTPTSTMRLLRLFSELVRDHVVGSGFDCSCLQVGLVLYLSFDHLLLFWRVSLGSWCASLSLTFDILVCRWRKDV